MTDERSPQIAKHQKFMMSAFREAEDAYDDGEIPVGAVVVHKNRIIGRGHNQTERLKDPTAHAEILAISAACGSLNSKYLHDCTMYVTLEPCPMCAGALVWSKIDRVVFGAPDSESGACGTIFNLVQNTKLNHNIEVIQGILEQDCEYILNRFFRERRAEGNGQTRS